MKSKRNDAYDNARLDLKASVDAPSYQVCADWMKEMPDSRSATLDFWARGNFVRRLLYNRQIGVQPILVPAGHPGHMRWVYRRLALAGVPVDIIYTGPLAEPQWIKHFQPLDTIIDSGWGYIEFPGTILRSPSGRRWTAVMGFAALMPESVLQWLAEEGERPFIAGRLFVSPAELIGLNRYREVAKLKALADISDGAAATESLDASMAILDLEIPWIDGMTSADFERLLVEHQQELEEFQAAFRTLVAGYHASVDEAEVSRRRVIAAVDDLVLSARHAQFRALIVKCKGSLTTFPVAMGMLAGASAAYGHDPFAGVLALAAAGKALRDLWKQSRSEALASSRSPYRVLLRLGVDRPSFGGAPPFVRGHQIPRPRSKKLGPYHWLCPPSCGLRAAVMEK